MKALTLALSLILVHLSPMQVQAQFAELCTELAPPIAWNPETWPGPEGNGGEGFFDLGEYDLNMQVAWAVVKREGSWYTVTAPQFVAKAHVRLDRRPPVYVDAFSTFCPWTQSWEISSALTPDECFLLSQQFPVKEATWDNDQELFVAEDFATAQFGNEIRMWTWARGPDGQLVVLAQWRGVIKDEE